LKEYLLKCMATASELTSSLNPISTGSAQFNPVMGKMLTVVQIVCYGAAVIILMIAGIRFMNAAPEGKAQIKQQSLKLATGAVIMFAAGAIVSIVARFAGEIS
jgi:NADH:ubiquinone oxidoreductase subunit 6 (subunit J)